MLIINKYTDYFTMIWKTLRKDKNLTICTYSVSIMKNMTYKGDVLTNPAVVNKPCK